MEIQFTELSKPEASRTYVFPNGEVRIENVTRLCVRPSGSHRVETAAGEKYIIPAGWIALKIEAAEWSF